MPKARSGREAAESALMTVGHETGARLAAIWTRDLETDLLRCEVTWAARGSAVPEWEDVTRRTAYTRGVGLPGRVWEADGPVWVDLVRADVLPRLNEAVKAGEREALGFPLWCDGRVVGVVELLGHELIADTPMARRALATVGRRLGQHVVRRNAELEAERATAVLEGAAAGARMAAEAGDAAGARDALCDAVLEVSGADAALVWHLSEDGRHLDVVAGAGWDGAGMRVALQGETSGAAATFASGQAAFVADVSRHAVPSPRLAASVGASSAYYEPLAGPDGPIGTLALAWHEPVGRLPADVRAAISLLAGQVAQTFTAVGDRGRVPGLQR